MFLKENMKMKSICIVYLSFLGLIFFGCKKVELSETTKMFKTVYEKNPNSYMLNFNYAMKVLEESGDSIELTNLAYNEFKKMHKKYPNIKECQGWYGVVKTKMAITVDSITDQMAYVKSGIALIDDAVEKEPNNIKLLRIRANNGIMLPAMFKRYETSIDDYKYILKLNKEKKVILPGSLLEEINRNLARANEMKSEGSKK